jgi:hypothetical protein
MSSFKNRIRNFVSVEDGLVTVEWVALTAGMVVAAVAIGFIVMNNTYVEGQAIGNGITNAVDTKFGVGGSNLGTGGTTPPP